MLLATTLSKPKEEHPEMICEISSSPMEVLVEIYRITVNWEYIIGVLSLHHGQHHALVCSFTRSINLIF